MTTTQPEESPTDPRRWIAVGAGGAMLALAALIWLQPWKRGAEPPIGEQRSAAALGEWAPSDACAACHEKEAAAYATSDHARAMQVATPTTVLGDFADVTFDDHGVPVKFSRRGDAFVVTAEGADGKPHDYEVAYTFGIDPLQQVLIRMPDGRIQCLTVAWDTVGRRWFSLYGERLKPDDPLHWTGPQQNWNFMCAECHSTGVRRGFDLKTNTFHTTWQDVTLTCQSCHGRGGSHVAWAKAAAAKGRRASMESDGDPRLEVRWKEAEASLAVDACARCHARRSMIAEDDRVGRPFLDHHDPSLLVEPLYHADGQILDEVYEYGSFLQSKMHAKGVRCTDCHDPHTSKLREPGNAMCATCHQTNPPVKYKTLAKKVYDTPAHHKHVAGKPGSLCVDCHMASRTYMVVDPRRDHSFRIPRPELDAASGAPDACTACHKDKTPAWASTEAARLWPREPDAPRQPAPVGPLFAAARAGDRSTAPSLAAVALDRERPAIVRATAIRMLSRVPGPLAVQTSIAVLDDAEGLVRLASTEALAPDTLPLLSEDEGKARVKALVARLSDPLLAVRVHAAPAVAQAPASWLDAASQRKLDAALGEFVARQELLAERPESHLNLARLHEHRGRTKEAEAEYRTALRLDPRFDPARFNLANLLNAAGRNEEAEPLLREVVTRDPQNGEGWYSLGLLLAEMKRLVDAADALTRAEARIPTRPRIAYNLGLVQQALDHPAAAEAAWNRAAAGAPDDPDVLEARVAFYSSHDRLPEAVDAVEKFLERSPGSPRALALARALQSRRPR